MHERRWNGWCHGWLGCDGWSIGKELVRSVHLSERVLSSQHTLWGGKGKGDQVKEGRERRGEKNEAEFRKAGGG